MHRETDILDNKLQKLMTWKNHRNSQRTAKLCKPAKILCSQGANKEAQYVSGC